MISSLKMRLHQGLKLIKVLSNPDYRRGLLNGVAAAIEHEKILRTIPFSTLIDIGANKGQFSLAAKHIRPDTNIIAFEPLHGAAEKYQGVFASEQHVRIFETAISPQQGDTEIYISKRDDSSSLLPITQNQEAHFPGTGLDRIDKIKTGKLQDYISPDDLSAPVLIKIDVQGFELDVLKGCSELLQHIDNIIVECSFIELYQGQALADQVIQHLAETGFKLAGIYNLSYSSEGLPIQADFIFQKQ